MIALALVSALAVLGSSTKASFGKLIDDTLGADFVASTASQTPFSPQVAKTLADVDGVEAVARSRWDAVRIGGGQEFIASVNGRTIEQALAVETVAGSLASVDDGGAAITTDVADERGLEVGDDIEVTFRDGKRDVPVVAVIE